jgi:hypothetical protein
MKKLTKALLASAALLSVSSVVSAHDLLNQTIGATLGSTDVYRMNCTNDGGGAPVQVYARIKDKTAGTNALTVSIIKGNAGGLMASKSSTDVTGSSTDATYSPAIRLAAGAPTTTYYYFIEVTKDTAVARTYDLQVHCEAAGNVHTGTSVTSVQNQ